MYAYLLVERITTFSLTRGSDKRIYISNFHMHGYSTEGIYPYYFEYNLTPTPLRTPQRDGEKILRRSVTPRI